MYITSNSYKNVYCNRLFIIFWVILAVTFFAWAWEAVSSVHCRLPSLFFSEVTQCFLYKHFHWVTSVFAWLKNLKSSCLYIKKGKKNWSCLLHGTAERRAKCHVWMIYCSNFLFVKRATGAVSKSFFAEAFLSWWLGLSESGPLTCVQAAVWSVLTKRWDTGGVELFLSFSLQFDTPAFPYRAASVCRET